MTKTILLERTYDASLDDVWDLWTTKEGLESWWGPEGFTTTVRALDLRVGGTLTYAMTATAAPQVEFMKKAGMPLTTESRIKYREIEPKTRLVYQHDVDFVPGVKTYATETRVELSLVGNGVKMRLEIDRLHDEIWTTRATMGWESQLRKLERALTKGRTS